MSSFEYTEKSAKELINEIQGYEASWTDNIVEEDLEDDEDFLYLEVEDSNDIGSDFHELGAELSAHTAVINNGKSYRLAVKK